MLSEQKTSPGIWRKNVNKQVAIFLMKSRVTLCYVMLCYVCMFVCMYVCIYFAIIKKMFKIQIKRMAKIIYYIIK